MASGVTVLSLCSGIGGLDLAAKEAFGGTTIGYVEIDPYCQAVLQARMRDGWLDSAPIWPDLRTFNGMEWRGAVDCIVAGFPCQPFSTAGRRQGAQDDRNLWPFVYRAIEAVQPQCVFLENVANALQYFWDVVLPDLSAMGYQGPPPVITAAAEVGAGHIRKRVYTLGYRPEYRERLLTYADSSGGSQHAGQCQAVGRAEHHREAVASSGGVLTHYDGHRCNGTWIPAEQWQGIPIFAGRDWWESEPELERVVHGLPNRIHRIRALGNSVVPAQAVLAWRLLTKEAT